MARSWMLALVVGVVACSGTKATPTPATPVATPAPASWLCLPGRADACASDLTTTEIAVDGTRTVVTPTRDPNPTVDCFYVYPTVDLDLVPRNHENLTDTTRMANVALAQVGHFAETCAIYAPLYRQVTLGTYLQPPARVESGLAYAFADVERAFAEYLAKYDRGRKIVLLGHSQGAEMIIRLTRRFFDSDPALRSRLLYVMPIGGEVDVASGSDRGGTFANIPSCTKMGQTGCVVAYRTYGRGRAVAPGRSAPTAGRTSVCVSPASIDGSAHKLSRSIFYLTDQTSRRLHGIDGITTPFVAFRDYYTGACEGDAFRHMVIDLTPPPGDPRPPPIDFDRDLPKTGLLATLGLHILDYQLAQGDLIEMIRRAK